MEKVNQNEENNLRKELQEMYTPLSVAKEEIWRRWNDKELRKKVDEFINNDVPEMFKQAPRTILARHVLSPNFELFRFLELSKLIELKSLCLEYIHDKFVACNIDKYHLCKLFFYHGDGKHGGANISAQKVIEFEQAEGKKINELKTLWGDNLVEFHHKLIQSLQLNSNVDFFDISQHYKRNGEVAEKYYEYFLALLICYGVLFENYLLDHKMAGFVENILMPNFKKIKKKFGVKPLIVPLVPADDEEHLYWRHYPTNVKKSIDSLVKKDLVTAP